MQRAKLIKHNQNQNQQREQTPAENKDSRDTQKSLIPDALKTTRAWVEEFQKAKQTSRKREFIALFS